MYNLIGVLLGLLPEVLYFTLFLIYTKNIKEKRIKLFLLTSIAYALCIMLNQYRIIYYLSFIIIVYFILKILYKNKTQMIDIFVFSLSTAYLSLTSLLCFKFVKEDFSNYYVCLFINRVLLFIIFIFKNKFNVFYKRYCKLWNRDDKENRLIKSITLRNISLIILNLFICCLNLIIIFLLTKVK